MEKDLTRIEKTIKNKDSYFYKIYNRELANEIIKLNKWMYFTIKEAGRNGKSYTVWYFEATFDRSFSETVKELKEKLDKKKVK